MNWQIPSPIVEIQDTRIADKKVQLFIKRDDLIHPIVNGNKYRKLKYNLEYFREKGYQHLITFGGAFSNHIHAVASAGKLYNIKTAGIIRGEFDEQNPTLQYAKDCGMHLHFISRSAYREKEKSTEAQAIINSYPNAMILPEGGTNPLALKGTAEITKEIKQQSPNCTHICVAAGTGGTAAGMIQNLQVSQELLVFSSLKGDFLQKDITQLSGSDRFQLISDYHFGGYGRTNANLIAFINDFYTRHKIVLDPIYNGKGLYGLIDLISQDYFASSSKILWVLTGGQQGNVAWNYLNGGLVT